MPSSRRACGKRVAEWLGNARREAAPTPDRGSGWISRSHPPGGIPTATSSSTTGERQPDGTPSLGGKTANTWSWTPAASTEPMSTARSNRCRWPTATRFRWASSVWCSSPGPRRTDIHPPHSNRPKTVLGAKPDIVGGRHRHVGHHSARQMRVIAGQTRWCWPRPDQVDQQRVVEPLVLRRTAVNRRRDSTLTAGWTRCTIQCRVWSAGR